MAAVLVIGLMAGGLLAWYVKRQGPDTDYAKKGFETTFHRAPPDAITQIYFHEDPLGWLNWNHMVRFSFTNRDFVSSIIRDGKLAPKTKDNAIGFWHWDNYGATGWVGPLINKCHEFYEAGTGRADTYSQFLCIDAAQNIAYFYEGR